MIEHGIGVKRKTYDIFDLENTNVQEELGF